jgi:hypothetical protein
MSQKIGLSLAHSFFVLFSILQKGVYTCVTFCPVSRDESLLISGGSDSNLMLWRDVTEKRREEAEEARQKLVLQEQELANLVKSDQLLSALKLALTLDRPLQVLRIIQGEYCYKRRITRQELTLIIVYTFQSVFFC